VGLVSVLTWRGHGSRRYESAKKGCVLRVYSVRVQIRIEVGNVTRTMFLSAAVQRGNGFMFCDFCAMVLRITRIRLCT